jgi:hypothetical protein
MLISYLLFILQAYFMQIDGTTSRLSIVSDNVILLHIVNYKCIHIFEAYIGYIILSFLFFNAK